ncbi:hypothetical protein HD841_001788 [Sphingomonas melonis]|uniref:Uncharacterized protein n=1 Tax=Sphingomonas melonis TaxID=152682 RepID=A0A7Y9FMG3_9SPHN|nr:hypothetical protein [Sphingomonas melonis]
MVVAPPRVGGEGHIGALAGAAELGYLTHI